MIHHTVSEGTQASVDLCYRGHANLPGPLCHDVIAKDGTVYLVGKGRTNHAGLGDGDVLQAVIHERALPPDNQADTDGNVHFYGFECVNLGDGHNPWPAAQLEAIEKAAAAICRAHGWTHRSVIGHLEWQPGKVDPRGFSMDSMRSRIADRLGSIPATPPKETGMSAADELKRLIQTGGVIPAANTAADRKTNKHWNWQTHITDNTNRIRAIHEESIPPSRPRSTSSRPCRAPTARSPPSRKRSPGTRHWPKRSPTSSPPASRTERHDHEGFDQAQRAHRPADLCGLRLGCARHGGRLRDPGPLAWVAGGIAAAGGFAKVMSLPAVEQLLDRFGIGLSDDGPPLQSGPQ